MLQFCSAWNTSILITLSTAAVSAQLLHSLAHANTHVVCTVTKPVQFEVHRRYGNGPILDNNIITCIAM